jgi:hypothetical protein
MAGVGVTWYRLVLIGYPLQAFYSIREFDLTPNLQWRVIVDLPSRPACLVWRWHIAAAPPL